MSLMLSLSHRPRLGRALPAGAAVAAAALLAACNGDSHEPSEASWLARAQESIAKREYHASENGQGLQAPNRRHNLRTYFAPDGIRVVDRIAAGSPRLVGLRLERFGREGATQPVDEGVLHSAGARVEIRRPGLVEWYENKPEGLEQGFTLATAPEGEAPLVLELAVDNAKAKRRGQGLVLETDTGRRLRYAKLAAWDAAGSEVDATLRLPAAERIEIVVNDHGARYPISVDPLLTEMDDAQLEGDQVDAQLGVSVASAGDVNGDGYADVIVGAWKYDFGESDHGAAFLFHGGPTGIANGSPATANTQLESDQANSKFGITVASAGDVDGDGIADVIVGASGYDEGQAEEGAAFVFLGSNTGVADATAGTADTRIQGDQAGGDLSNNVASAGDVDGDGYADVIVGMRFGDNPSTDEGATRHSPQLRSAALGPDPPAKGSRDCEREHRLDTEQTAASTGAVLRGRLDDEDDRIPGDRVTDGIDQTGSISLSTLSRSLANRVLDDRTADFSLDARAWRVL